MNRRIKKVAVLGAGVMGSSIAAHMTNAGLDAYLLDIVPPKLDDRDIASGLSLQSPAFRNRFAEAGLQRALKAEPPAFYVPENAKLIITGNFDDNLDYLRDTDWVIEAIIENLETKKQLLNKIDPFLSPDAIISTNTSGLPVNRIAEGLSERHRQNFLGTHFFNPPRYMKLVEIIPSDITSKEVTQFIAGFCEKRLGKGIVFTKDTPNFIANRIGIHNIIATINTMVDGGYSVEEADAITGTPLGRPRSATFRLLDMVGLDTFELICRDVTESPTDLADKGDCVLPPFIQRMLKEGLIGDKRGQGFFKKVKTEQGQQVHALDYETFQYVPERPVNLSSLNALKGMESPAERISAIVYSDDRAGQFAWRIVKSLLLHSAARISEIAEDIVSVDRAMKWGFNHELGPFEMWDAIGVRKSVEKMGAEGEKIPENVTQMLSRNKERFYLRREGKTFYYDFRKADYREIEDKPDIILLPSLKERGKLIKSNNGASLIDIGEGVACLEFHTPRNTISTDIIQMIDFSIDEVADNWEGLIIGSHRKNFCVGGNLALLLQATQDKDWHTIEMVVRQFQDVCRKIKLSEKPVVAAPFRMTLGGGCEICLAASHVRASAETYIGQTETAVGLVPAGGGCKEMLIRSIDSIPAVAPGVMGGSIQTSLIPFVMRAFETIAMAKVSTSAIDARKIGYLTPQDKITFNQDYLLRDAKETVIALVKEGYQAPRPRDDIRVTGRTGYAAIEGLIYTLKEGAFISEYDAHIGRKLASILTGGNVPQNTLVTEDYLLELERECFLSLCGEEKSQARMKAMLQTGQPLRN